MKRFMDEEFVIANEEVVNAMSHNSSKSKRAAKYARKQDEHKLHYNSKLAAAASKKAIEEEIERAYEAAREEGFDV